MEASPVPAAKEDPPPPLLRKLRRKADWESKADLPEDRARDLFDNLFCRDQLPYSLYRPGNEAELQRVALAMNATRRIGSKLADEAFFVAFPVDAMEKVGFHINPTPGETDCRLVNHLHFDVTGSENQLREILLALVESGQQPIHLSKNVMRQFLAQATAEQCRAVPTAAGDCTAVGCPPAA